MGRGSGLDQTLLQNDGASVLPGAKKNTCQNTCRARRHSWRELQPGPRFHTHYRTPRGQASQRLLSLLLGAAAAPHALTYSPRALQTSPKRAGGHKRAARRHEHGRTGVSCLHRRDHAWLRGITLPSTTIYLLGGTPPSLGGQACWNRWHGKRPAVKTTAIFFARGGGYSCEQVTLKARQAYRHSAYVILYLLRSQAATRQRHHCHMWLPLLRGVLRQALKHLPPSCAALSGRTGDLKPCLL